LTFCKNLVKLKREGKDEGGLEHKPQTKSKACDDSKLKTVNRNASNVSYGTVRTHYSGIHGKSDA